MHLANPACRRTPFLRTLAAAAALSFATSAGASIMNPDFSAGFSDWQAERVDSITDLPASVASPAAPEFTLPGGGLAKLSNNFDFYEVSLFQEFALAADAGTIAIDYDWSITDAAFDVVQISLRDVVTNADVSLFVRAGVNAAVQMGSGRLVADISDFAGRQVELLAFVQDGDFFEEDMLAFGNIAIASVSVPAPASLLLSSSLLLLGFRARRRLARG